MKILFATISLVLGLYFLRNNIVLSIIISLVYVVFIFARFSKKCAFVYLTIFIGGAFLGNLNLEYNNPNDIYQGVVLEVKENYFIFQSHYEKYYVYEENTDKEIGDFLTLKSSPTVYNQVTYESRFDFKQYLLDKGVKRSLTLSDYNVDFRNPIRIHSGKQKFLNRFDENAKALINAVIFNEKDYSSLAIETFNSLNLIYLISVSGIYLHSLFAMTTYVFGLFASKRVSQIVPILLFLPLAILSFPRISILRIFIVSIFKYINDHFLKKRFSYLTLLSSLALFFVIIDFHLVYQQSFYLGFLLSLLGVFFRKGLLAIPTKKRKMVYMISVYIFLMPIMCMNNNVLHLFSFPFQLMLTPLFLMFILLSCIGVIHIPIYGVINSYADLLVRMAKTLSKIDITLPIMVNGWFLLVFYSSIMLLVYFLEAQRFKHIRNLSLALATLLVISLIPIQTIQNGVYFINVGQGDSILIHNHQVNVLIDTGGNSQFDMAKEVLIPFFNKVGVRHIDLLVTTHDDFDHAGAANSLIENFKVYYYANKREDFPYKVGDIYLENINYYDGDENDSSLVFLLDFMKKKWLLTGDASEASEKAIIDSGINIDCDILKVGHHGSSSSTSEAFLRASSPSEAIISCGAKNRYKHPHQEVLDRLARHNVKIRRTDLEGTISYVSIFA